MKNLRWRSGARRARVTLTTLAVAVALATGFASSAGAYGGGASHDVWQVGMSFNCNNPAACSEGTGGDWGWLEFDRSADGTQTWGDAEFAFCFHTVGGGGAGAGHGSVDISSWTIAAGSAGPQTFFASGTETDNFRGMTETSSFTNMDTGFLRCRATTAPTRSSASLRHPALRSKSRSRSGPRSSGDSNRSPRDAFGSPGRARLGQLVERRVPT